MMYAYIFNGLVDMIADQDYSAEWYLPTPMIPCPDEVQIGWVYDVGTNTFSAPPPPPLTRLNFQTAFNARLQQEVTNWKDAKFEEALALSPNYPALPESIAAFQADMDTMDWTWVQAMLEQRA